MISINVNVDEQAMRKFENTLNELAQNTRMEQPNLVAYAAGQVIAYAIRSTPITRLGSQALAPPAGIKNPDTRLLEPAPQSETPRTVSVNGKGFLKSGWARSARNLRNDFFLQHGIPDPEFGDYEAGVSGDNAWMEFFNAVPYIEDVMSGSQWSGPPRDIGNAAINGARHSIKRFLQKAALNISGESGFRF